MRHTEEVLRLLEQQIGNSEEVEDIARTAAAVAERWVNPVSGGAEETNGLIYGLVQSGKTGVLSVTAAMGADEGYRTLLILTSDIEPLYEQTVGRIREALPGHDIIGKSEFKAKDKFLRRVKSGNTAIVTTKNASMLGTLVENFRSGKLKGLSCLIIDDEADQASLNTRESKADGTRSRVNERIVELRHFFEKNTYLQVTATPQALFLREAQHDFRPKFTVLSHPGSGYVGGDDFFGGKANLVREFPLADITMLTAGGQPAPRLQLPASLERALDVFIVGATFKRASDPNGNCAFLCHVSTKKADHDHIVQLMYKYREELTTMRQRPAPLVARMRAAFDDLAGTHPELKAFSFEGLLEKIAFLARGTHIKLVNGDTEEDVAVKSPYNLFVGGNKLGRGVTIKNLLVSYYGRNPSRPQADTVLQHARMYGYRRGDIGLLRLFLPGELHVVFRSIHKMETSLRELIAESPTEEFRGVYIEGSLGATRRNVLAPGAVGTYVGGGVYNPSQVVRDSTAAKQYADIASRVAKIESRKFAEASIDEICELISMTRQDESMAEHLWNSVAVAESVRQWARLSGITFGRVYVDRSRGLREARRESQGILDSGEAALVPADAVTLFLLELQPRPGEVAAWWPQLRFPKGRYAFAFAL